MQKILSVLISFFLGFMAQAQDTASLTITVLDGSLQPVPFATVALRKLPDSALVKLQMTGADGRAYFSALQEALYTCLISHTGFSDYNSAAIDLKESTTLPPIVLQPAAALTGITVVARKPFVELKPGRTIVNVEAGITMAGATAMEALEKMPGITIDRDGGISLKGRSGVLVLIDGKQTFLDAAQLSTLLNGMNASQIEQVEIMDQPPAGYDAAGNAGIINIKTKKNRQRGFNGSLTTSYAQGYYPKNNNSFQLAYRRGKWNLLANYSINVNKSFTRIYALRTYFKADGAVASMLEQPSFFSGSGNTQNLRLSTDYSISDKTTLGLALTGLSLSHSGNTRNQALWMNPQRVADSLVITESSNAGSWRNGGASLSFRHAYSSSRELAADVDVIGYRMRSDQLFENKAQFPTTYYEATRANIPSDLKIVSAKTDYTTQWKEVKLAGGLKASQINTDNLAVYEVREGLGWKPDYGKSNHFLYNEKIKAAYISGETKQKRWSLQAGLRAEATAYDAKQLGNAVQKDSSFSRKYNSLFPTMLVSFEADSNHSFSFTAGRRIDRPAFQKLNPFIFIINKYTYQQGNPFFRPQFTWNMDLSHVYKSRWITSFSYSITNDYFSQIFPLDNNGLVIYTEGNLEKLQQFTLSLSTQLAPAKWWSLSAQATGVHKKMEGVIGRQLKASIAQATLNLNNQFRLKKGWSAELTGFYTSRSQADIQEIVDPAGQLSVGVAKSLWQNKATVKLAARDVFHTQWMKGNTFFPAATEYFKLTRDTRVALVSFSYRFGKTFKTNRRSEGSAGEEIRRVGNG
jgi:hypothetical protein